MMPSVLPAKAQAHEHTALKAAVPHGRVDSRDDAGGGDQQAEGQFSRCIGSARGAARGVADQQALAGAGRDVQRRDRGPRDADHTQFEETPDQGLRKSRAPASSGGCRNLSATAASSSVAKAPKTEPRRSWTPISSGSSRERFAITGESQKLLNRLARRSAYNPSTKAKKVEALIFGILPSPE
jgi:hypothetical protein